MADPIERHLMTKFNVQEPPQVFQKLNITRVFTREEVMYMINKLDAKKALGYGANDLTMLMTPRDSRGELLPDDGFNFQRALCYEMCI